VAFFYSKFWDLIIQILKDKSREVLSVGEEQMEEAKFYHHPQDEVSLPSQLDGNYKIP